MENNYLTSQLITYIGNKRKLLESINNIITNSLRRLGKEKGVIFDGFSGSGVVSRLLKNHSDLLYSNDLEKYCYAINRCYLSNISEIDLDYIQTTVEELNNNKLIKMNTGFIEKLYAPKNDDDIKDGERVFYTNTNAKIIDNLRRLIESKKNNYFFLAPLLSEASIHTNTSGVFKGFYKNSKTGLGQFGGNGKNALSRIISEISLPVPIFSEIECDYRIFNENTNELIKKLDNIDITYYDPPYNQHPYGSNYFMLNLIYDYKKPEDISEISGIPKNWNKSNYNYKETAIESFEQLIKDTDSKIIIISYNNEGIIPDKIMFDTLKKYGKYDLFEIEYNTFRGSRNLKDRELKTKERIIVLEK